MKTKMTITELNHEDLVNLLSTATFGSSWLACRSASGVRDKLDIKPDDCREDVWAKALLSGYPIYMVDYNAEGCVYGDKGSVDKTDEAEPGIYRITLEDIKTGLQSAMDGDFAPNDEEEVAAAARCVLHLRDEAYDFDNTEAELLAQIIMFGTLVY